MVKVEMQFNSADEAMEFLALYKVAQSRRFGGTVAMPAPAAAPEAAPAPAAEATAPAAAEEAPKAKTRKAKVEIAPAAEAPKVEPTPEPEAKPEPKAEPKAETKAAKKSFQDIRDIIGKHTEVNGLEASKKILGELGYVKASAIPEDQYGAVYAKFEDALDI